jgi:hypothetical protein
VHHLKLLFPARSRVLPKSAVFLIDRMPRQLAAFFNLSFEELIQTLCPNFWRFRRRRQVWDLQILLRLRTPTPDDKSLS